MATIVLVGRPAVPVRYESWEAWRADVTRPLPPAPLVAPQTASCALCWGQGRLWHEARNGEGLVPSECPRCVGAGLVLRGP
ncbi:MAG TPA: hypothetical protein VFG74_13570 [Miltoncostaeaceae bacterium]|nr:hypothetical protein [Miltoncostaeaceae bacterium]